MTPIDLDAGAVERIRTEVPTSIDETLDASPKERATLAAPSTLEAEIQV